MDENDSVRRPLALITGVGRTVGIGAGIARQLAASGWDIAFTYWSPYDRRMDWGVERGPPRRSSGRSPSTARRTRRSRRT